MTDRSTAQTVAIIGAGIRGCYFVGELRIAGFKLRLHDTHDIDASKLAEVRARGGRLPMSPPGRIVRLTGAYGELADRMSI